MESWAELATRFRSYRQMPSALANADLLDAAESRWSGHVEVYSSMDELRFVPPGEDPRRRSFPLRSVRVSFRPKDGEWVDGVFSFELWLPAANNPRVAVLRSADKASRPTAPTVLDAFLMQLTGDEGRTPPS
jgi:hypothetical protein